MIDPIVPHRALLADGTALESLLFHDCIILGAGVNTTGERVIFCATGDDSDLTARDLHAVVDEQTYLAFRYGSVSLLSILGMAPFYLVSESYVSECVGRGPTIVEMTLADLADDDRPTEDSFCPDFSQLPRPEAT